MVLLHVPLMAHAALTKTCLTGTAPEVADDRSQIPAVRALVEVGCPCANFDGTKGKRRGDYVACALEIIKAETALGQLRAQCKATVKKYYARSTCGRNPLLHSVPCVETNLETGAIKCKMAATTKNDGVTPSAACTDTATATRIACPTHTRCIDAADTNGDLTVGMGDSGDCHRPPISSNTFAAVGWKDSTDNYYVWDQTSMTWLTDGAAPEFPALPSPPICGSARNCCRGAFCYSRNSPSAPWVVSGNVPPSGTSPIQRTGIFVTPATVFPADYGIGWCLNNFCYRWAGWNNWVASKIDQTQSGDPDPPPPPSPPSPGTVPGSGFAAGSFCSAPYCYEQMGGVWGVVALVIPSGARVMIPPGSRPDGEPSGFCDSVGEYCYEYTLGGPNVWTIRTFSGLPPGVSSPSPVIPPNPVAPPVPPFAGDYTTPDGSWTFTSFGGIWLLSSFNAPQGLPLTSMIRSFQQYTVEIPPISSNTFATVGWKDSTDDYYAWDQTSMTWLMHSTSGAQTVAPPQPLSGFPCSGGVANCCVGTFCYSNLPTGGVVSGIVPPSGTSLIQRTGIFVTPGTFFPADYNIGWCLNGLCYRWAGWSNWVVSGQGAPEPPPPPPSPPPPGTVPEFGFTADSFCSAPYCYERIGGEWGVVALVIPSGASVMIPPGNRPDGEPSGWCESSGTYCFEYSSSSNDWTVRSFSGVAPPPNAPALFIPPIAIVPPVAPTPGVAFDYSENSWTWTYDGIQWKVSSFNAPEGLPLTSTIRSLQAYTIREPTPPG